MQSALQENAHHAAIAIPRVITTFILFYFLYLAYTILFFDLFLALFMRMILIQNIGDAVSFYLKFYLTCLKESFYYQKFIKFILQNRFKSH